MSLRAKFCSSMVHEFFWPRATARCICPKLLVPRWWSKADGPKAGGVMLMIEGWWCDAGATLVARRWWRDAGGATLVVRRCWRDAAGATLVVRRCWRDKAGGARPTARRSWWCEAGGARLRGGVRLVVCGASGATPVVQSWWCDAGGERSIFMVYFPIF